MQGVEFAWKMTVIDCLASLKGEEGKFVLQNDRINWTSPPSQISIPLQQIKLLHVNQQPQSTATTEGITKSYSN